MIEITLGELVNSEQNLVTFMKGQFPITTSYALSKSWAIISAELLHYRKMRDELIIKFGKKDDMGNVAVSPENAEEFYEAINELHNTVVNLDTNVVTIPITALGNQSFTPIQLASIAKFVEIRE